MKSPNLLQFYSPYTSSYRAYFNILYNILYTLTDKVSLPLGCPVKCLYSWRPPKEQEFRVWVAQGRGKLTFIGPQVKPALTGLTAPKKGLSSLKWPIYRNKSQQEITAKTRNFHLFKMAGIGLNSPMWRLGRATYFFMLGVQVVLLSLTLHVLFQHSVASQRLPKYRIGKIQIIGDFGCFPAQI